MPNLRLMKNITSDITLRKKTISVDKFVDYCYIGSGLWVKVWNEGRKPILFVLSEEVLRTDLATLLRNGYTIYEVTEDYEVYIVVGGK